MQNNRGNILVVDDNELTQKSENEEFIVGWIHSHPGLDIFLSGTDVATQKLYQQMDSRAVAIVVDPTKVSRTFPGLKAFRVKNNSYHPLEIKIQTSTDFETLHQQLSREVSGLVPPQLLKEKITVSLDNITLNVTGPNVWFDHDQFL